MPLDYISSDHRAIRLKTVWLIVTTIVVLMLLFPVTVRQNRAWVDAIGGSHKRQTVWRFGWTFGPTIAQSPLAERFEKLGLKWEPDWRNVEGTSVNLFGRTGARAHGFAPEIYPLATMPDLQKKYLAAASDDEVRDLFRTLITGTSEEKKNALDAVLEKAFKQYPSSQGH